MNEGMALGFIVDGEPRLMGSGGAAIKPEPERFEPYFHWPYTMAEHSANIELVGLQPGPGSGPYAAALEEVLGKLSQLSSDLDVSPERAAAVMFYATEHQLERWQELLEFFSGEVTALITEAMEATKDGEGNKRQPVGQLQEVISDIVDEVVCEICDGFCHWPFVCANEDELDEHCDKCPLSKLF